MPDGRRRSRDHWTDTMEAPPADPPAHVHRLPSAVRWALVGLVGAVFLLAVAIGLMAAQVYQASQYVTGKGEQRDRERIQLQDRIDDRTRAAVCDLLDTLPEGGLLDRPRDKYGCGPGTPLESLTPAERAEISGRASVVTPDPSAPPLGDALPPRTLPKLHPN